MKNSFDVKNYKHDAVQNYEVMSEKWQVAETQPYEIYTDGIF